jgi:hypothetical protein
MLGQIKIKEHEHLKQRITKQYPHAMASLEWRKTRHGMEIHVMEGRHFSGVLLAGLRRMIKQHNAGLRVV